MHFDLEMALVIGSVVTGLVWLMDIVWLRSQRQGVVASVVPASASSAGKKVAVNGDSSAHEPWYIEYSRSFFPVLIIVLILRAFVAEPFRIPSGSMMPTLLVGDFILVNKFSYGIRLPVVHNKIVDLDDPERGDVVVFRWPKDPSLDYIKRVIGVPGDRIKYENKQLYINDQLVETTEIGPYKASGRYANQYEVENKEVLFDTEHHILINSNRRNLDYMDVVPKGHYFVMGDNRDNSNDSRFWGFVPEDNLVGKAMLIWMNWDFNENSVDFSRIAEKII